MHLSSLVLWAWWEWLHDNIDGYFFVCDLKSLSLSWSQSFIGIRTGEVQHHGQQAHHVSDVSDDNIVNCSLWDTFRKGYKKCSTNCKLLLKSSFFWFGLFLNPFLRQALVQVGKWRGSLLFQCHSHQWRPDYDEAYDEADWEKELC